MIEIPKFCYDSPSQLVLDECSAKINVQCQQKHGSEKLKVAPDLADCQY